MHSSFVVELVRWWCHIGAAEAQVLLTEDFEFDSGLEVIGREDFLASWQHSGSHEELEILEVWALDERASVMFEADDEVTGMRHRFCWLIVFDEDRVRRVRACAGRVPKGTEKPRLRRTVG